MAQSPYIRIHQYLDNWLNIPSPIVPLPGIRVDCKSTNVDFVGYQYDLRWASQAVHVCNKSTHPHRETSSIQWHFQVNWHAARKVYPCSEVSPQTPREQHPCRPSLTPKSDLY